MVDVLYMLSYLHRRELANAGAKSSKH
jgi:hypothetical protein